MTSRLNRSNICFCYGRVDDNNIYDDRSILGSDIACSYCLLGPRCKYYDEQGHDNRRCLRYLSYGTRFVCVLYCGMGTDDETRKRNILFRSQKI